MEEHRGEYGFTLGSILTFVWRGVLVGIFSGIIVSLFRLLIEEIFHFVVASYGAAREDIKVLALLILASLVAVTLIGLLVKSDPDIKGSGIPHVEGELKGLLSPSWWSVLWKKFVGGTLAISMGFMLGREGPSIQLGAVAAKGLARFIKASRMEKRVLIASGAAAGLSAAFNAPIAGLVFVVEEVYHHFSRLVWITALVASLVANFISLTIFGLKPVLAMPTALPHLALNQYWILILLGVFLGLLGYGYEKVILNVGKLYQAVGRFCHLPSYFYGIIALLLTLPIGYFSPHLLGGGSGLIISLSTSQVTLLTVCVYFLIRFIWSMIAYGSGMPGGIFLPMLTLGSLAGLAFALAFYQFGLLSKEDLPLFIVLGMSGYFGAISKAPLTAMILVTEMVGDLQQLMSLGVVTLVAYIVMDLLKGEPIYEAMLDKMAIKPNQRVMRPTLIELTVSDKMAGKKVKEIVLPKDVLITTQVHGKASEVVSGNTVLLAGATIFVVANESELGTVRELLM